MKDDAKVTWRDRVWIWWNVYPFHWIDKLRIDTPFRIHRVRRSIYWWIRRLRKD